MIQHLHPEFAPHAKNLREIINWAQSAVPTPEQMAEMIEQDDQWKLSYDWAIGHLLNNRCAGLSGFVYAVPLLNEGACNGLLVTAKKMGEQFGFVKNPEEGEPEQIPEIVLAHHDQEAHDEAMQLVEYINIWFLLIYHVAPKSVSSIQFTKYTPENTASGGWHHDRDSDFTAVVSLAPELFEGGGTDIRLTPTEYFRLDKLSKGYALLLNGKQTQHRGREVTAGERHLLTFWMDSAEEVAEG